MTKLSLTCNSKLQDAGDSVCHHFERTLAQERPIVGSLLVGSFCDGWVDHCSDLDIWCYVSDETTQAELQEIVCKLPSNAMYRNSHSGKYVLCEFVEQEILVSVKFIRASQLNNISAQSKEPQLNEILMEDLDTFMKCSVLFGTPEFKSRITRLQESITNHCSAFAELIQRRYGDLVWRSVFQGPLRGELLQWKMLMYSATQILLCHRAMNSGRMPVAQK